jgi:hypothetical protein
MSLHLVKKRFEPLAHAALRTSGSELLQRSVDSVELSAQVRSETVNHRDDSQRDTGCDQAIFNCRSARFIRQKVQQGPLQFGFPIAVPTNPNLKADNLKLN